MVLLLLQFLDVMFDALRSSTSITNRIEATHEQEESYGSKQNQIEDKHRDAVVKVGTIVADVDRHSIQHHLNFSARIATTKVVDQRDHRFVGEASNREIGQRSIHVMHVGDGIEKVGK